MDRFYLAVLHRFCVNFLRWSLKLTAIDGKPNDNMGVNFLRWSLKLKSRPLKISLQRCKFPPLEFEIQSREKQRNPNR